MRRVRYRYYLLAILVAILTAVGVDSSVFGLIAQDLKVDFGLSDTQLGFLTGIAFALFYSVVGLPIARWADRGNRVLIIALTAATWGLMVALCGLAVSFSQLLLIRIGVAIGEAGCIPPAHSLIPDYFQRAERPRATAIYMLGGYLSMILGYFVAGWLNELYGWRVTLMMLGLPGIALGVLAQISLREPRKDDTQFSGHPGNLAPRASLKEVCRKLARVATFRQLIIAWAIMSFLGTGIAQWQPAFFMRSFGLKTGELGTWFALIYGVGGVIGTYFGGELAVRYAARNERLQFRVISMMYCLFAITTAGTYLANNAYVAFGLMSIASLSSASASGPVFATIQTLVPPRMRATSIALVLMVANLIGTGFGPLLAGMLSDGLRPVSGEESLRYSLLLLCPGYFWVAWHLWRAGETVIADLAAGRDELHDEDVSTAARI